MQSLPSITLWLNLICCFVVVLVVAAGDLMVYCSTFSIPAEHSVGLHQCVLHRLVCQSVCNYGKCNMAKTALLMHHQTSYSAATS